jgi:hypothetical protein
VSERASYDRANVRKDVFVTTGALMKQCTHCWHEFDAGGGSDQVSAQGEAWVKSMTRIAEEIFLDPEARGLALCYCCKCGERRVDQLQRPLLRAYGR